MKKIFFALCSFILLLSSCSDSTDEVGLSIRPDGDLVGAYVDTFHINTSTFHPDGAYLNNTKYLIGEHADEEFGTVTASLLAQFMYPKENLTFPENATLDSMTLRIKYSSFYIEKESGDPEENVTLQVFKMTNKLQYREKYYSNIDPSQYTDVTNTDLLLGEIILSNIDLVQGDSVARDTFFKMNLDMDFARSFMETEGVYASEDAFLNFFSGLYIKPKTANRMLYTDTISLQLSYNYPAIINERDTILSRTLTYPANNDVRQVNALSFSGMDNVLANKAADVDIIYSPAGFLSYAEIPLDRIMDSLLTDTSTMRIAMNSVKLMLEPNKLTGSSQTILTAPSYMLLLKESDVKEFFEQNELPDGKTSFYASLATDTTRANYYTYTFDMTYYVQKTINDLRTNSITAEDIQMEKMVLIPVSITFNNGSPVEVKNATSLSAFFFRNNKHETSPFKLDVIYSKYHDFRPDK